MKRISASHLLNHRCVHFSTVSSSNLLSRNVSQRTPSTILKKEWKIMFEEQAKKKNISLNDLYQLDPRYLDTEAQDVLKKEFNGSVYNAVSTLFPETEWLPWKFAHQSVPRNYWKEQSNQRKFFDDLGKKLGVQTLDDWYDKLSVEAVDKHGGARMLSYHSSSVAALEAAYPEHKWLPWRFRVVPSSIWTEGTQRHFLDWLGNELGVQEMDDWYERVSIKEVEKRGGRGLLDLYDRSVAKALMSVYSEYQWMPWRFSMKPPGFWESSRNQRLFMDWVGKILGINSQQDWYKKVSLWRLRRLGGQALIDKHKTVLQIMKTIFPEQQWEDKFQHDKNEEGGKKFFFQKVTLEDAKKMFEAEHLTNDEWYTVSLEKLDPNLVNYIKHEHRGLLPRALAAVYPEIEWLPWKFKHNLVPKEYWTKENQRKFTDYLAHQLGITQLDDWYQKASAKVFREHGGSTVMLLYGGSPAETIMNLYPEHDWVPFKFNVAPSRYWSSMENQRKYVEWLGAQLGVQKLDDWYEKLSQQAFYRHGGSALLTKYKGSPIAVLMAVYPEHKWVLWQFSASIQIWNSKENVRKFVEELSEKLVIKTLDDWYRVDLSVLKKFGARAIIGKYRGLYYLLKEHYPHHPWDPKRFQQRGKKTQRWLAITLRNIFPDEEIIEDYLHPKVKLPSSNRSLELDVFIPSKSLAFEYQGIQHYQDIGVFSPTRTYQERDEEKRTLCAANNIKLIEVPYWWNRTQDELRDMIKPILPGSL